MRTIDLEKWLKKEIFKSAWTSLLFVFFLILCIALAYVSINYVFNQAQWTRVLDNLQFLAVYNYPSELLWRPFVAFSCLIFFFALVAAISDGVFKTVREVFFGFSVLVALITIISLYRYPMVRWYWVLLSSSAVSGFCAAIWLRSFVQKYILWFAFALWVLASCVLLGFGFDAASGFRFVNPRDWGGVLLTSYLCCTAALYAFPFALIFVFAQFGPFSCFAKATKVLVFAINAVPMVAWFAAFHLLLSPFLLGFALPPIVRAQLALILLASTKVAALLLEALANYPTEKNDLGLVIKYLQKAFRPYWSQLLTHCIKASTLVFFVTMLDFFALVISSQYATDSSQGRGLELFIVCLLFYALLLYPLNRISKSLATLEYPEMKSFVDKLPEF